MEAKPRVEKIHPNSQEYSDFLTDPERSSGYDSFIGESLLKNIDSEAYSSKLIVQSKVRRVRQTLTTHGEKFKYSSGLIELMWQGKRAAHEDKELANRFDEQIRLLMSGVSPDFMNPEKITDEMLLVMLREHKRAHERKSERQVRTIAERRESFNSYFTKFSQDQNIEIPNNAFKRLEKTRVVLLDRIESERRGIMGHAERDFIVVAEDLFSSKRIELDKTLAHEFIHTLGGITVIKIPPLDSFDDEIIREQRLGLIFVDGARFDWLAEATVEDLANQILPKASRSYKDQRRLYKLLRESGRHQIPRLLFQNAHFENYDPSLPYGQRIPHWKKLWHAINDSYEPGFLVKVDDIVRKTGIQAAIEHVRGFRRK